MQKEIFNRLKKILNYHIYSALIYFILIIYLNVLFYSASFLSFDFLYFISIYFTFIYFAIFYLALIYTKISEAYRSQVFVVSILLIILLALYILTLILPHPLTVYYKYVGTIRVPDDRSPPSWDHLLGTNDYGYDQLVCLIHSLKNSIFFGFFVGSICVAIAILMGVIGPYIGGIVDEIFSLITNIALAFPVIPFILLLNTMIEERSMMVVAIVIALFNWPWAARAIRSEVLSLKERNFVKLAKVTGESKIKIAFLEIVPNLFSYIFLVFIIIIGVAIIVEAGISMIGLGQQEIVTLGVMLYWSETFGHVIRNYYSLWVPPGLVLTIFIVMIYLVHSSLSQIFNPKLREK